MSKQVYVGMEDVIEIYLVWKRLTQKSNIYKKLKNKTKKQLEIKPMWA